MRCILILISQGLIQMKPIIVRSGLVPAPAAVEPTADIPGVPTLGGSVGASVHRLILPVDYVLHKEVHLIGLCLGHQTLLRPVLDYAVPCHFDTLGFEARPADEVLVGATLAYLAHLIVIDLLFEHVKRRLRLMPLGLDLHVVSHRFYRHFLDPQGDLLPELFLSAIFIDMCGMHRVHDLELWEHVDCPYPGVRQDAQLVSAQHLIELVVPLLQGFLSRAVRVPDGLVDGADRPQLSTHADHGFACLRPLSQEFLVVLMLCGVEGLLRLVVGGEQGAQQEGLMALESLVGCLILWASALGLGGEKQT